MEIQLKIDGTNLLHALTPQLANGSFPKRCDDQAIEWRFTDISNELKPQTLLTEPEHPEVLLFDVPDNSVIGKIHAAQKSIGAYLQHNTDKHMVEAPIIVVFPNCASFPSITNFPDFVSDWITGPVSVPELARRVLCSLQKKRLLNSRKYAGALSLAPDSKMLSYDGRQVHLTPSEILLAQHFFNHMGSVIPFNDFAHLFRAAGKSVQPNNIRVAMFQLRLKLEILTKSAYTLENVYKQGYCIRQKIKQPFAMHSHQARMM